MARKYPRFLLSNPSNTKSSGPFIIHTLAPQFIVKPEFDEKRNLYDSVLIDVWSQDYDSAEVYEAMKEIPQWFKHSGRFQSNHEDDLLLVEIEKLDFLLDYETHLTVDQARKLIRLLFPTKSKSIYELSSSYGLKHLFEKVSRRIIGRHGASKYCGNDTAIEAFEKEGFQWQQTGPNRCMNISAKELKRANRLFNNYHQ
ncbi:hypothetical protein [Mucilaginibacter sp.]